MGIFGSVVRGNFANWVTMVLRQSSKTCAVWRRRFHTGENTGDMVGPYCFKDFGKWVAFDTSREA